MLGTGIHLTDDVKNIDIFLITLWYEIAVNVFIDNVKQVHYDMFEMLKIGAYFQNPKTWLFL